MNIYVIHVEARQVFICQLKMVEITFAVVDLDPPPPYHYQYFFFYFYMKMSCHWTVLILICNRKRIAKPIP